jgi:hypothetical protein
MFYEDLSSCSYFSKFDGPEGKTKSRRMARHWPPLYATANANAGNTLSAAG